MRILPIASSRADYYLLQPIAERLGVKTYILKQKSKSDTPGGYLYNFHNLMYECEELLLTNHPEAVLVLGDRYEIFAACIVAHFLGFPIAHIQGGETTWLHKDQIYRDSISSMASLHLPCCEEYKERLLNHGYTNVYNVGSLGSWLAMNSRVKSEAEIRTAYELDKSYVAATWHAIQDEDVDEVIEGLSEHQVIWTYPGNDPGYTNVVHKLINHISKYKSHKLHTEVGQLDYFSLCKYAKAVIGNSSSLIYEVPVLNANVLLIGNRQKGRIIPSGVKHVICKSWKIKKWLRYVKDKKPAFSESYYRCNTPDQIIKYLKEWKK